MPLVNTPVQVGYTADGPAAAAIVNQQLNDWQNQQQRDFTTQDINNGINQNTLDNALLNNPLLAAQRATALGQSQNDLANLPVKNEADVAKYIQGKSDSELKVAENRADLTRSYASMLEGLQGPAQQAAFVNIQKEAASKGLKFDSIQDLQSKGQAAVSFMKTSDALKIGAQKIEGEKDVARINAQGHVDAAKQNVLAAQTTKEMMAPRLQQMSMELTRKERSGEGFSTDDIAAGMEIYKNSKTDYQIKLAQSKFGMDAGEYAAMKTDKPGDYAKEANKYHLPPTTSPQDLAMAKAQKEEDDKALQFVQTSWPKGTAKKATESSTATPAPQPVASTPAPTAAASPTPAAATSGIPQGGKVVGKSPEGKLVYELNGKRYVQ